jgi:hypothetical protein
VHSLSSREACSVKKRAKRLPVKRSTEQNLFHDSKENLFWNTIVMLFYSTNCESNSKFCCKWVLGMIWMFWASFSWLSGCSDRIDSRRRSLDLVLWSCDSVCTPRYFYEWQVSSGEATRRSGCIWILIDHFSCTHLQTEYDSDEAPSKRSIWRKVSISSSCFIWCMLILRVVLFFIFCLCSSRYFLYFLLIIGDSLPQFFYFLSDWLDSVTHWCSWRSTFIRYHNRATDVAWRQEKVDHARWNLRPLFGHRAPFAAI